MSQAGAVLIVGGYGVVGEQIAAMIRQRHPEIPLLIGGRNADKATSKAAEVGNATGIRIDVSENDPLASLEQSPAAVICAVHDVEDGLLLACVRRSIPYVDIARWTDLIGATTERLRTNPPQAPVLLASNWMAGVPAIFARAASDRLANTDSVDIDILYALSDKAGPDSATFVDSMTLPFQVFENGEYVQHRPYQVGKSVTFPIGGEVQVHTVDTPDNVTVPKATGAQRVHVSIGMDDPGLTKSVAFMAKTRLLNLFNLPFMKGLRRSLFFNTGEGGNHEILVRVSGIGEDGSPRTVTIELNDPEGQSHLTACGAVLGMERTLGLGTTQALPAGVYFADASPDVENAHQLLKQFGVAVKSSEPLASRQTATPA